MSHQHPVFGMAPALEAWSREASRRLPFQCDVDASCYLGQERKGFDVGSHEPDGRPRWDGPEDPMPTDFSFQPFPGDLGRIASLVEDATRCVLTLAEAGLQRVIDGLLSCATDAATVQLDAIWDPANERLRT